MVLPSHPLLQPILSLLCAPEQRCQFNPTAPALASDLHRQGYVFQCYPKRPKRNQEAGPKSKVSSLLKGHTVGSALNCCCIGPYRVCKLEPQTGATQGARGHETCTADGRGTQRTGTGSLSILKSYCQPLLRPMGVFVV